MKEILFNLALIDAINFCKEQKIDPSGTYLSKYPRKFRYVLIRDKDLKKLVEVTFSKNSVPTHAIYEN